MANHEAADGGSPSDDLRGPSDPIDPNRLKGELLKVHRAEADGTPGVLVGRAHAITTSAALFGHIDEDGDPQSIEHPAGIGDDLVAPEMPLTLVNRDERPFEVVSIHRADEAPLFALEIEESELDTGLTLPARSFWCRMFPRMRGC